MNQPTVDLETIEAALASLAEPAPPTLAHGTLVAVGLADDYAVINSPVGPLHGISKRQFGILIEVTGSPGRSRVRGAVLRADRPAGGPPGEPATEARPSDVERAARR